MNCVIKDKTIMNIVKQTLRKEGNIKQFKKYIIVYNN